MSWSASADRIDRAAEWPGDDSNRSLPSGSAWARRLRMGRVSISVNEWAHLRTPKSCREMHWLHTGFVRPTFKEVTRK